MISASVWERDLSTPGVPTFVAELPLSFARQWREVLNGTGSGRLSVAMEHPEIAELTSGRIIRFYRDGDHDTGTLLFSFLIREQERTLVDPAYEAGRVATVAGLGPLCVLAEAVIYPDRPLTIPTHSHVLRYDFSSAAFDDSGWDFAVETPQAGNFGEPGNWPDQAVGQWIWSEDSTTPDVPVGDCYMRQTFVLDDDSVLGIWIAADDQFETIIDNEPISQLSEDQFYVGQSKRAQIPLAAGTHIIAIKATNVNVARAGVKGAFYILDEEEQPETLLFETDDTWKVLGYPAEPPGFPIGEVLREMFAAAFLRGCIQDVTVNFTDTEDSNGDPWTMSSDITVPHGANLLEVILQLAETYIDVRMSDDMVLSAWNHGGAGTASGITFEVGSNLARYKLSRTGGDRTNVLLVRLDVGHIEVEDTGSSADGRVEGYLTVGSAASVTEAERLALGELARDAKPAWRIDAEIEPLPGEEPYVGMFVADTATAPNHLGAPTAIRVVGLSMTEDDMTGVITWPPQFEFIP